MSYQPFGPFVVIAAIAVALYSIQRLLAAKREKALADIANRLGFSYEGKKWSGSASDPKLEAAVFKGKYSPKCRNIMSGNRSGLDVCFFDYAYGAGRSRVEQTLGAFTKDVWLPDFQLASQDMLHKLGDAILHKQITFEAYPDFAKRFRLRGADPDKVRELFSPELLVYLVGFEFTAKWQFQGSGKTLFIFRPAKKVKPEDFSQFVEETTGLAQTLFTLCGVRKSAG